MVSLPELGGVTQARTEGQVEVSAREYIAVSTNLEMTEFDVTLRGV